jgi:hypothetical protein
MKRVVDERENEDDYCPSSFQRASSFLFIQRANQKGMTHAKEAHII